MLCCPCEHFEIKAFTLQTDENQQQNTRRVKGECYFEEIKNVYNTRARKATSKLIAAYSARFIRIVRQAEPGVRYASQVADYFAQVLE